MLCTRSINRKSIFIGYVATRSKCVLLLLHVVCPIIGNNRHNRDNLDSNNCSAFFFISPNTTVYLPAGSIVTRRPYNIYSLASMFSYIQVAQCKALMRVATSGGTCISM